MDKKIVIWDIDGTIADTSHRMKYITEKPKNWPAFVKASIEDAPLLQTQFIYHAIVDHPDTFTIVMTARGEEDREITEAWLERNKFKYDVLIMRDAKDNRKDWIVKSEKIDHIEATYGKVFMAFEDRPGVIKECYNAKGIWVFDVGQGTAT